MGWPNEYNIIRHPAKRKECCIVQHLFGGKFDRDQTSYTRYNTIQHNTTRYNKMAKRVQHFIQHESCMMLYEMLYSFGRGLNKCCTIHLFPGMLYDVVLVWPPHANLLYSVVLAREEMLYRVVRNVAFVWPPLC